MALTAELPEENLLDGTVIFDRTELNRDVIFPVTAKAFDRQGVEVVKDILWSSSDTSIAKVDFYSFTEFNNLAVGVTLAGAIRENGFPSIIGIVSQA